MTKGRVEVITSVLRRRRFCSAEKQQLVSASLEPGASVSAVAREAGIHPGQLACIGHDLEQRSIERQSALELRKVGKACPAE
jgi:transposase